jgi:hypothetical protein
MKRWLPLLIALSGCKVTYTHITEIGGVVALSLAPVEGDGITVDLAAPGMTEEQLASYMVESENQYADCPEPHMSWALDSATSVPLFGILRMCIRDAPLTTSSCDTPVELTLEVEDQEPYSYIALEPEDLANGLSGFIELEPYEPLGPSGSLTGIVPLSGDCLGDDVPHTLDVTWNFPVHDERTTKRANQICCGPLVARTAE